MWAGASLSVVHTWFSAKHERKTKGSFSVTRGVPIVLIVIIGLKGCMKSFYNWACNRHRGTKEPLCIAVISRLVHYRGKIPK